MEHGEWDGRGKAKAACSDTWKKEDQFDEKKSSHSTNQPVLVATRSGSCCWREPSNPWARFREPQATSLVAEDPSQEKGRQRSILSYCEKRISTIKIETKCRRLASLLSNHVLVSYEKTTWFDDARGHSSACLSKLFVGTSNDKCVNLW